MVDKPAFFHEVFYATLKEDGVVIEQNRDEIDSLLAVIQGGLQTRLLLLEMSKLSKEDLKEGFEKNMGLTLNINRGFTYVIIQLSKYRDLDKTSKECKAIATKINNALLAVCKKVLVYYEVNS